MMGGGEDSKWSKGGGRAEEGRGKGGRGRGGRGRGEEDGKWERGKEEGEEESEEKRGGSEGRGNGEEGKQTGETWTRSAAYKPCTVRQRWTRTLQGLEVVSRVQGEGGEGGVVKVQAEVGL